MKIPCLLLVALMLPALAAPASRAEEDPPGKDFEATVSAFPAPSENGGFDVQGRVEAGGTAVGGFRLAATADPIDGKARWRLVEERRTTFDDVTLQVDARVVADPTLHPLTGVLEEVDAFGDELRHTWKERADGYRVETQSAARQAMGRTAAKEGPCLTTLAALVLFARLAPAERATYETRMFHPDWDYLEAERPFVATRLVLQAAESEGEGRLRLTAIQERARIELVLDAATRNLRTLTIRQKDRPVLVFRPGTAGDTAASEGDLFAAPSATPRGCAARVALAFATVDAERFAAVIHWPTLRTSMRASIRGQVSDEAFRASILDQFRRQGEGREPQPLQDARAFLEQEAPRFTVDTPGETEAVVTLSEAWERMRLTLCRVDGDWYLARLPGR